MFSCSLKSLSGGVPSQRQVDLNQDLLMKIRHLEEKEGKTLQALNDQLEKNKSLRRDVEEVQKQANDNNSKLSAANQVLPRSHPCAQP